MVALQHPHLPQNKVTLAAVGKGNRDLEDALQQYGTTVITLEPCLQLPRPIQSHADLLLHHAGNWEVWLWELGNATAANKLRNLGFRLHKLQTPLGAVYPQDVPLCCFSLGGHLLGRKDSMDKDLLNYYHTKGQGIINVRQGYTKCSCAMVDHNSVITADRGLGKALELVGITVLYITPGYIQLPGYPYGFIGGCCGLIAPDKLAFYGDLKTHPDHKAIRNFCSDRGIETVRLGRMEALIDVGGIVPLIHQ